MCCGNSILQKGLPFFYLHKIFYTLNWKKISGKNTIVLSQKEQTLIKSWLDEADSLGGNQEDEEKSYLKERIFVLEKFLDKEQTSNSELKKIIQQTQNLLDQQQRLALQDKKLLERNQRLKSS
ncbi:hypothetical protein ACR723_14140 [Enterococcus lactis]